MASTGYAESFGTNATAVPNVAARLKRLRRLAWLLDNAMRIPGIRTRVGLSGVLGLTPAVGDIATGALSMLIVAEAYRLGVPQPLLARMLANVAIEVGAGAVPVVGNLFDIAFKANLRNLAIIEGHFADLRR